MSGCATGSDQPTPERAWSAAWTSVPAEEVLPGITRQTVHGVRQSLVRYVYAPGAIFPRHAHPEEQITIVVRGRLAFDIAGQQLELGPGEVAIIPGGLPHAAAVVGTGPVETLNALSPRRELGPDLTS